MHINQFARLFELKTLEQFSQAVFQVTANYGFEQCMFRLLPSKCSAMDEAFVLTNHAHQWRAIYDEHQYSSIDPTIHHCYSTHFPLLWDQGIYASPKQQAMYDQGKSYGLSSGLVFPIHGANGEFGMMNFATEKPSNQLQAKIVEIMPLLSVFKDYVFESSKSFNQKVPSSHIELTPREKEVINWCAAGKTSWEISRILSCSESTVNFHLSNVRHKFNASNTQLAVVKALRCGLIYI
ncbi:helix-turn-helix transcriptional regulator [Methylobacillus pratensis]|uniref:helix-turn-helix transcriptional regulator n=1 Tax=Methylobacillus flagellatus TaxID=405 RepID=UPI002853CFC7|nr:LuxR family transcriptional regulator [Methylobacillus flagellatus]MDR5171935.1 LuxR family transcriptional regulator [Methylobacillus flagellatus]